MPLYIPCFPHASVFLFCDSHSFSLTSSQVLFSPKVLFQISPHFRCMFSGCLQLFLGPSNAVYPNLNSFLFSPSLFLLLGPFILKVGTPIHVVTHLETLKIMLYSSLFFMSHRPLGLPCPTGFSARIYVCVLLSSLTCCCHHLPWLRCSPSGLEQNLQECLM